MAKEKKEATEVKKEAQGKAKKAIPVLQKVSAFFAALFATVIFALKVFVGDADVKDAVGTVDTLITTTNELIVKDSTLDSVVVDSTKVDSVKVDSTVSK
jgi:hypothetical protein